jgi:hypothetical protein
LLPHLKPFPEVEVWISDPTGKQIVRAQETAEVLRNVDPNTEQDKWPIGLLSDGTLNIVEEGSPRKPPRIIRARADREPDR